MKLKNLLNEDRFGHPVTAESNKFYIAYGKMSKMLTGKEKRKVEQAWSKFWAVLGPAKEAEEQK
jgi:hypothetical protein